ncbi:MAG TPA: efflux RND transporter periplasmic adaptor subunit, partial [Candidatus Limivivens merdigallinarum]|nr:efflux RND transporter periplasmic adaptor subunit [Candidatus Limivivens merdigallinarum]
INITPEPDTPQEPTTPAGTEPATPDATEPVQTEPQTDSDGTLIINPGEDGTEPTTESETETETETETEIETSPLGRLKAYKVLNYRTKPYKGEGTKEKPYVFFCVDGAIVQASFMNKLLGFNEAGTSRKNGGILEDGEGCYAILEIREGDDMSGGFIKSIQINGTVPVDKAFAPDVTWTFTTNGLQKNVPEITEPSTEPDTEDPGDWIDDDFQFWDDGEQYTVSELQQAITDKKAEIQELELTLRENDLEIAKNQRELDNATVVSSIHGVVKTVGDVSVVSDDGEPFILVTSDSGLYIQGTINEMDLDKYTVGTEITATSWDSYETVTAEITEISEYPASSLSYWSSSENMNVSAYPFLAYVAEPGSLAEGDGVEIQFEQEVNADSTGIYLEKMYVRSENGQSYVYIDDGNGRLKKQYVKTGKNSYGTVEILEGLTLNDKIAFPYSADAKEGARTRNGDAFSGDDSYSGEDSSYSGDGSYSGEDSSYSGDGSYLGEDSSYSGDGSYLGEDSSYSGDGSYSGGDSYLGEVSSYSGEDSYLGEDTYLGEGTYLGEDSYLEDTYSGESSDGSYFGDTYSGEDF